LQALSIGRYSAIGDADCHRYELRSEEQLDELARAPLPLGIAASATRRSLHTDLYLDTPDDTLRHRGVVCRLRVSASDERLLSLRISGRPGTPTVRVDSRVNASEVKEALKENSAARRRLRGVVDPALLKVRLELEVDRLTRTGDNDWLRRPRIELHYDRLTVRRDEMSQEFHQLCVHRRRGGADTFALLAHAFEATFSLRPAGDPRARAELLAKWSRRERLEERRNDSDVSQRVPEDLTGNPLPAFLNPELSLLAFQARVIALAEDAATPLRERLRFLSIVTANIDEFFMVRMAGLKRAAREQVEEQCEDGLTRREQLDLILERVSEIIDRQARCLVECERELAKVGVRILDWKELSVAQRSLLRQRCRDEIHPALTPMAMTLSPGHPLPHLPHLTLGLAAVIRGNDQGRLHLAELEIPFDATRFMRVPDSGLDVIPIEEVIRANLDMVYEDAEIEGAYVFRVTRGGDLALNEEAAEDLLDAVEEATERRPNNPAVRVEAERGMPELVRNLLIESLRSETVGREGELRTSDIQEIDGLLDLRCLSELELPALPELVYPHLHAVDPLPADQTIFDAIRDRDLLVHHPFESFAASVVRFLDEASTDPDVTAIKITLYRVGDQSPIVENLLNAARRGKQVVAFVELKARFDEEHNVAWARKLEQAGGHVVYGLIGLKNHAKVTLVVRRENGKLERYVHVGTGNYNTRSGLQYTDLSLFSARDSLTADVADLFNALTGSSRPPQSLSREALVSPHQILETVLHHIEREAAIARAGRPARITAKLNGLSDSEVVRALYRASCDGVETDLVCRGICTLRPGVPGQSERIRVTSVVGRFLEHSRIYRFGNDNAPQHLIGSSDLRPRNLRRRVELLVPVFDPQHKEYLDRVLSLYLDDATAWELRPGGDYIKRAGSSGAQAELVEQAAVESRQTV